MNQKKTSKRAKRYVCSVLTCIMILTLSAGMASSQTYAMSESVNGEEQNQTLSQPSSEETVTESQVSEASPGTAPSTEIPATEVPATEVPATEVPATEVPATQLQPAQVLPTDEITIPAVASDISFIDVNLQGREFSTTASVGAPPYYQVFRFTTPAGGGGSYTFYTEYINNIEIDSYAYLCTENQYRDLCNRIETQKYQVPVTSGQCLDYNDDGGAELNFYINYNLEPGTTYYFIGTRYSEEYLGDYKLVFARDIQINLDNQSATSPGSTSLYSKGNLWYMNANRTGNQVTKITAPQKTGYTFQGYYTQPSGQGDQVITGDGMITNAIDTINENAQLYAKWVADQPNIIQIDLRQDGATVPGTETLFYKEGKWYLSDEPSAQAVTSITVPQKTGYDFKGYFNDRDGKGTLIISADGSFTDAAKLDNIGDYLIPYWVSAENPAPNPGDNPTPTPTPAPEGSVTGSVDNGNTSLQVSLDNETNDLRDKALTDEQKQRIIKGENARIYLKITDVKESVSKEDKEHVKDSLNGYSIGQYLDLSLWAQIGSDPEQKITNTNGSIRITIDIPKNLLPKKSDSGRGYRIIRVHDGKASVLKSSYDEKNQKITFETDKFSTYTLVYRDKTSKESEQNVSPAPSQPVSAEVTTISGKDDVPKTGDQDFSWIYLLGLVCFSGGTVFFGRGAYKK